MRPPGLYTGSDLCRHCGRDFLYPAYGWRGWCNACRPEAGPQVVAYCTAWIKDIRVQRSLLPRQCRHTIRVTPEDVAFAVCAMHRRYGGARKPTYRGVDRPSDATQVKEDQDGLGRD